MTMQTPRTSPAIPASPPGGEAPTAQQSKETAIRWTAVRRARLPHKAGLPLSSSGCGDAIER
ncbi:MAG TPA: hypothetical protein VFE82_07560 [Ramlibacter sp.]|jgi:hypothetical protein|uniref:hypothetical protein n=1 Tax=Ramlibacter sp. TaxID=1917967 RepID=UPI002D6E7247|nr:hypothetical protein [Ramlibacter sp.]HZY18322.1 hypothetical protein [Ramlibacter sp.]